MRQFRFGLDMDRVAAGVKVFSRADKLRDLLQSLEGIDIGKVYVADDGKPSDKKSRIYNAEYDFDLQVIDLEYDAGLGYGRNEIVDRMSEDFLLLVDADHEVPTNVGILKDQLEASPELGGVSGMLLENGRLKASAHDLHEEGETLVRDIREEKQRESIAGHPVIKFDFLPNSALFRRECLADYSWDPNFVIGWEHLDFYIGHKLKTDWKFGVCPSVLFEHSPGGGETYLVNRKNREKLLTSKEYLLSKWDYDQIVWNDVFPDDFSHKQVVLNKYLLRNTSLRTRRQAIDVWDFVQRFILS